MRLPSSDQTARAKWSPVLASSVLVLVLAGCSGGTPLDTLDPQGPSARTIHNLVVPVFAVAAVVFLLVEGAILFIVWRFRSRSSDDPDELPEQVHGNTKLEIGWTIVPTVILAVVALGTVVTIFELEERDDDALRIDVAGQQWWWEFGYDTDGDGSADLVTATEMVIPVGRQVDLAITSNDVVHSFWIPRLNGKRDAVPGRTHTLAIQADEPGYYWGQCTEYCGLSHAKMRMRVVALPEDEYEEWLAEQVQPAPEPQTDAAQRGRETFLQLCATCHRLDGSGAPEPVDRPLVSGIAPDLTHFASRRTYAGGIFDLYDDDMNVNRSQLAAWLRDPTAEKPMYSDAGRGMPNLGLTEAQIADLIEYLMSTSDGPVWTGPRND